MDPGDISIVSYDCFGTCALLEVWCDVISGQG